MVVVNLIRQGTGQAATPVHFNDVPALGLHFHHIQRHTGSDHEGFNLDLALEDGGPLFHEQLSALLHGLSRFGDHDLDGGHIILGQTHIGVGLHQIIVSQLGVIAADFAFGAPAFDHIPNFLAVLGVTIAQTALRQSTGHAVDVSTGGFHVTIDIASDGLTIHGVIHGLFEVVVAGQGVLGVLHVDVVVIDHDRGVRNHTGVIDVSLDGVGIRREGVQLAGFEQLHAGVHFGNDTDLNLVIVEVVSQPVIGILLIDMDIVVFPLDEAIGTAADPMIQIGTIGGGQAVRTQALFKQFGMDGIVGTGGEVGAEVSLGNGSLGGDLDGAIVDLLDTDIFPGDHVGMTLGALQHVVIGILDGDVVVSQEGCHGVGHHGIQNGLEGVHIGVGVDGIAVGPLGFLTDGELPGQVVDLLGHIGSQVGNVMVTHAVIVGNGTPQGGVTPGQRHVVAFLNGTHTVHGVNFAGQIGVVDLVIRICIRSRCGSGGGRVRGRRRGRGCRIRRGSRLLATGGGHRQQHQCGHQQCHQLLTHENISFTKILLCGLINKYDDLLF